MLDDLMALKMLQLLENKPSDFDRNCFGTAFYVLGFIKEDRYIGLGEPIFNERFIEQTLATKMQQVEGPQVGGLTVFSKQDSAIEEYMHMAIMISAFSPYKSFHRYGLNQHCELFEVEEITLPGGTPTFYVRR